MSSFICSSKHFNSIEKSVIYLTQDNSFYWPYSFKSRIPELYRPSIVIQDAIDLKVREIVDTLRELNVVCVCLQYKHHYPGTLDKEIEDQKLIVSDRSEKQNLSKIELYKALQCLNYQIETEHLKELRRLTDEEETALFFIRELSNGLATDLVCNLPAYNSATWSI